MQDVYKHFDTRCAAAGPAFVWFSENVELRTKRQPGLITPPPPTGAAAVGPAAQLHLPVTVAQQPPANAPGTGRLVA